MALGLSAKPQFRKLAGRDFAEYLMEILTKQEDSFTITTGSPMVHAMSSSARRHRPVQKVFSKIELNRLNSLVHQSAGVSPHPVAK